MYMQYLSNGEEVVEEHIDYARSVARKVYNSRQSLGVTESECESAALFGLCEAASRYDPEKNVLFKSFSYPRLKGAIIDEIRSYGNFQTIGGISRRKNEKGEESEFLSAQSNQLGLECYYPQLNIEVISARDEERRDLVYGDDISQEDRLLILSNKKALRDAVLRLPEKERIIVVLHYFLEIPITDLCPMMGASKSWLSRLHLKALDRLKIYVAEELSESPYTMEMPLVSFNGE